MSYKNEVLGGDTPVEILDLGSPLAPIFQDSNLRILVKIPKTGEQSPVIELVSKDGSQSYTLNTLGLDKDPDFKEALREFFSQSAAGISARGLRGDVAKLWLHYGLSCAPGLNQS